MPGRSAVLTIPSPGSGQGDDSWVKIKPSRIKDIRALVSRYGSLVAVSANGEGDGAAGLNVEAINANLDATKDLALKLVKEWNWADEDGVPLPQLADNPDVFDELTMGEMVFLSEALVGQLDKDAAQKKLTT